ncbi:pilus assembly protein Flp/PilA [Nitrosospira multiformis]|uniref:Pilus assembly protein Flp/PilA n=1 Tax=Nitrosospira multiformis TaxID=1231 RepID=A0A1I0CA45_9PROT|nr:Flp family type IVb pilin [Nitrosospira multiformis]SET16257.1 pilus assembly protein Flp/PilA [Nitrosospira multiformis]
MNKIAQGMKQFLNDEEGVTAIEYGLIAALVAVGIIASLNLLKGGLDTIFTAITTALTTAAG